MGKGDKRRPTHVRDDEFEDNWNRIFGRKRERKTVLPLDRTQDDDLPDHPERSLDRDPDYAKEGR